VSIPGSRAQGLFAESGIEVIVGAPVAPPEDLAAACIMATWPRATTCATIEKSAGVWPPCSETAMAQDD